MKFESFVSVIIPCYNQGCFLGEAIESVLAQTYLHYEILVVNDGSSDNTAEVVVRYPSVRYFEQHHQGVSAARNTGIRESSGDYIVFLDADDRLSLDAIEVGVDCLNIHPECAFVSGRYRNIKEDGTVLPGPAREQVETEHYLALLRHNYIGMHATVMYRRFVLEAIGGFNPALQGCEEYDVFLRIAREFPIMSHDKVVAEYRQHDANASRNYELMLKSALAVLRSQWDDVRGRKQYRKAYHAGRKYWRKYYGKHLIKGVHHFFREKKWKRGLQEAFVLFRYDPPAFVLLMLQLFSPGNLLRNMAALWQRPAVPSVGRVRMGDLHRVTPLSNQFGYDRGQPIDRYYIEKFLTCYASDIRGRVLEVGDDTYTRAFGESRVTGSDILHVAEGNPRATLIGDLTRADHIPSNAFDCIILTQTLHLLYDVRAAIQTLHRILRPGGVLLATFPGISQISTDEWAECWYWSFTTLSARRFFEESFPPENITIDAQGNVFVAASFLYGLAVEELQHTELDYHDPHYPVTITLRAVKPGAIQ